MDGPFANGISRGLAPGALSSGPRSAWSLGMDHNGAVAPLGIVDEAAFS